MSVHGGTSRSTGLFIWGAVLPPLLWFSLMMLDRYYHLAFSGGPYMGWIFLFVVTIIGGVSCFWLRIGPLWRIIAFIAYLPLVAGTLAIGGIFVACYVFGDCP
jgi:hypothetical protein